MSRPDLAFEKQAQAMGFRVIAGVDEVGRGPLAGPIVAAAVVLSSDAPEGLDDSKRLSPARREHLAGEILGSCAVGLGVVASRRIERTNIRIASLDAMRLAVAGLYVRADYILIDGDVIPEGLHAPAEAIVKGDGRSRSIAAASIVAKFLRDRMMVRADKLWPGYGFASHKGYGVAAHRAAIARLGPCPLHRMTFAPLREMQPTSP